MTRRLLNLLTVLSLLLCVAAAAMGWRSHRYQDSLYRRGGPTQWRILSLNGRFFVTRLDYRQVALSADGQPLYDFAGRPTPYPRRPWAFRSEWVAGRGVIDMWQPSLWKTTGVQWAEYIEGPADRGWMLRVRWSSLGALAAVLPASRATSLVRRWFTRRRRSPHGFCPSCAYDLIPSPKQVIAIVPGESLPRRQPTPRP